MTYKQNKDYKIKYIASDGKTKEVSFKPEKDMNTPAVIQKLKEENEDFFKLIEGRLIKQKANKLKESKEKMSYEDWIDYIDIIKEYPDWFKDKSELDRPFLEIVDDHKEELWNDYQKYLNDSKTQSFKEYVKALLKSGTIDDPEHISKLSDEEFEDLLVNTWMKDPDIIKSYKELNENKENNEILNKEYFGHTIQDDIDEYDGPVGFDRFYNRALDYDIDNEAFEKYGSRSNTNIMKLVREYYKEYKNQFKKIKQSKKEESKVRDASDRINSDLRYEGNNQSLTGIIADRIADIAEELGDDYSEWLGKQEIKEIDEEIRRSTAWVNFTDKLDDMIKEAIIDKVDWIRRDEPASKYYEPDEELDESKNLNNEDYKIVEKTIQLTDDMLKEIPLPSSNIVFDEEIEIPIDGVYKNNRIRLVVADNDNRWNISEYDISDDYGYGGYTVDLEKTECPTINDIIKRVFINGDFADYGYSIAGVEYPEISETELKESKETLKNDLSVRDNTVIVNKNQFGYNTIGIIIDDKNKQYQLIWGQVLPIGKYKKASKKAIRDKAEELKSKGYTEVKGPNSLAESKTRKTESVSYNDLEAAGEDLWGPEALVYDTKVSGIYWCNTAGHGGYLVDINEHPELSKYGTKTVIDNIVGFEEDYEALKVMWVYPELIDSENFKNKISLDLVLHYDDSLNDDFRKEFPEMKAESKKTESEDYYNWKDDVNELENIEENDDLAYAFAEHIVETNPEYKNSDPMEVLSNIIYIWKIDKDSKLYKYLLDWYGSKEKMSEEIREFYETSDAIYFETGAQYAIFDQDLLGGTGDGRTEKEFEKFLDKKEEKLDEKYNVYTLSGEDGVYNSNKVDTVDTVEQAEDRVRELQAETGNTAYYEEADEWWEQNYKRAINYVANETPEVIVELFGYDNKEDNAIWDMYTSSTSKSIALELLHYLGQEEFEKVLDEYERSLNESYVSYEEPFNGKSMSKDQWKEYYDKEINKDPDNSGWETFEDWWQDVTQRSKLIVDENIEIKPEKKLNKDNKDEIQIGDILADNSNRYVIVDIIEYPRSKAITVRDEKDWRPIYASPLSDWYGTTIIKGPFIRKDGVLIKENKEDNISYKEAAKLINDISTEEIVGDLVKNKDCDKRLKDIWKKYKALQKLNIDLDDDKYIELDNEAENIINELVNNDLLNENKEIKTEKKLSDTEKVNKALNYLENEYNEIGNDDYEFLYRILTQGGSAKSKVKAAIHYINDEYNELNNDDCYFLTNILVEAKTKRIERKNKEENLKPLVEDNAEFLKHIEEEVDKDYAANEYYNIEDWEWQDMSLKEKLDIWLEYASVNDITEEFGIPMYEKCLQLSDKRVLWDIENETFDADYYGELVTEWLENFESDMQRKGWLDNGIWQDGRSGRHIVIDISANNIIHYKEIRDAYEKLENEFIEYCNNFNNDEDDE